MLGLRFFVIQIRDCKQVFSRGQAKVKKVPARRCAYPRPSGFAENRGYGKHQDLHRTANFGPAQLCAMGGVLGAQSIYRVQSLRDLSRNQLIDGRHS